MKISDHIRTMPSACCLFVLCLLLIITGSNSNPAIECYADYSIKEEGEWTIRTHRLDEHGRTRFGEILIINPASIDDETLTMLQAQPYSSLIISRAKTAQFVCDIMIPLTRSDELVKEIKVALRILRRA